MTTPWQPGQLLVVGFRPPEGASTEVPREIMDLVAAGRVGGVILFARNLGDPASVRKLVATLQQQAPEDVPVLISIDQEGGRVQRLREPWTEWPPMRELGEIGEAAVTARVADAIARELLDLGIELDFAPVVDVDTNPNNPVIGDRSFAREAERVSLHARAFVGAMQEAGVAACAKHFPGHGDTDTDSHQELPRLRHDLDRLRAVELAPFRAAAEAGVASMMTAHVLFEALDRKRPATISPDVMQLLRGEIGYDGVVFSDDLEMKAVRSLGPRTLVRGALEAGVDGMLVCSEIGLAREVLGLLERMPDGLVERPIQRMHALKERYAKGQSRAPSGPPYPAHVELAQRIRERRLDEP